MIKRLAGQNKAGLIAVAKELGIELTDMDFPVSHEEIADAQLIGVTGGTGENGGIIENYSFNIVGDDKMYPMSPEVVEAFKTGGVPPIFQDGQG